MTACGSYRGISGRGRQQGDSSEKAALWRHDDTPLDTFSHDSLNSRASLANHAAHTTSTTTASANSNRALTPTTPDLAPRSNGGPRSPDSQVVACTVHAPSMEGVDGAGEGEGGRNRLSTSSSGFSSFLAGKDSDLNDLLASSPLNPYATVGDGGPRGGSLPRRWGREGGGGGRGGGGGSGYSTLSGSFKTNGELGNIYEAIDTHRGYGDHACRLDPREGGGGGGGGGGGEQTPLVPPPPPSPPLPPPPPPIAADYDDPDAEPWRVDHYTVNNDEYALVRKPKAKTSPTGTGKAALPPGADYTNLPCLLQHEAADHALNGSADPTYDTVDIFRDEAGPVVGFRPTSGPYDRDRSSKSEPVSPSSGGTSRHRWDEL